MRPADGTESAALVGCGQALGGQELVVVDPVTSAVLPPRTVGELWLRGPSVARGYRLPGGGVDASRFTAVTADGDGPYLRTGDLGFLDDEDLYVTGRLRDIVIVAGRNLYPQDAEATAEGAHAEVRPGCTAVFSVTVGDAERLGVMAELRRGASPAAAEQAVQALRSAIAMEHGSAPALIVLVASHTVPKTTSGKIRRAEARRLVLEGQIRPLASHVESGAAAALISTSATRSAEEALAWICAAVARHSGVEGLGVRTDLGVVEQGLSSLQLAELSGELEEWLGRPVDLMEIWDQPDLVALAEHLTRTAPRPLGANA